MRIGSVMHACYSNMMFGQHNVIILLVCAKDFFFFYKCAHVQLFMCKWLTCHVLMCVLTDYSLLCRWSKLNVSCCPLLGCGRCSRCCRLLHHVRSGDLCLQRSTQICGVQIFCVRLLVSQGFPLLVR